MNLRAALTGLALCVLGLIGLSSDAAATGLIIPVYSYPNHFDPPNYIWDDIAAAPVSTIAIINPADGPGGPPNADYLVGIGDLHAGGVTVIGYLSTDWAARPAADIEADVDLYDSFFGIDGVFFDEVSVDPADAAHYQALYDYVATKPNLDIVVGNPGVQIPEVYVSTPTADKMILFEGFNGWPSYVPDAYVSGYAASKFGAMVYRVTDADTMRSYIDLAVARNLGFVYISDDGLDGNPWDRLPSYWNEELAYLSALSVLSCGDGIVDLGEQCDGGACCTSSCEFSSSSTQCRASAGICDVAETCTGSAATCPADGFASVNAVCRGSAGVCDVVETCSGSSATCPADAKSTTVCRSAVGDCDVTEFCDGSSNDCPADVPSAPETICADDGDICTDDECDGAAICVHTFDESNDPSCIVTTTTMSPRLCDVQPTLGCKLGASIKSKVQIKLKGGVNDQFAWKFRRGDATVVADFLNPVGSTPTTRVCVWDAFGKIMEMDLLPGGLCGGKPCWRSLGTKGFNYTDKAAILNGLTRARLVAGTAGRSQVQAKGKGSNLPSPVLPLTLPVTVELIVNNGFARNCWQNTFATSTKNDASRFRAKGP